MKRNIFLTAVVAMLCVGTSAIAQTVKRPTSPLEGLWQMCFYVAPTPDSQGTLKTGNTFKVLTAGGYIMNFTSIPTKGAIITGYGTYEVLSDKTYKESMIKNIHLPVLDGKSNLLDYELKDGGKLLQLKFFIEKDVNGNTIDTWHYETWKRVEMPDVYPEDLER